MMTHRELVGRAERWLRGTRRCSVTATEITAGTQWRDYEIVDAIGWIVSRSYLIECKTSRADFRRDATKPCRADANGGAGNVRYYMAEPGIIPKEELPDGWGLLEVYPRIVKRVVEPKWRRGAEIGTLERPMLVRAALRLKDEIDCLKKGE